MFATLRLSLWVSLTLVLSSLLYQSSLADEESKDATDKSSSSAENKETEEEPKTRKVRIAQIVLRGNITEVSAGPGLLGQIGTNLRGVIAKIEKAATDDSVDGLILHISNPSIGRGRVNELRQAIDRYRKSGKPAYAYFESASTPGYLVASACDKIFMPTSGEISIPGVYMETIHFRTLFDFIGIDADFMHIGEAKAAAETFTRKDMSPAVKANLTDLVDDFYQQIVEQIASGRGLRASKVKKLIDQAVFPAAEAKQAGLIDLVAYPQQVRSNLAKALEADELVYVVNYGKKKVDTDFSGTMGLIKLMQAIMGAGSPKPQSKAKKIALIYAVGPIMSGKSAADILGTSIMGSDTIVEALQKAKDDKQVAAVVLRIDSPGGSALASDMIWNATQNLEKPIVASMGDVAGSGGYYIAMGCDQIFAEPGTLTGSIGVVGGKIATAGFLRKLGISTDSVSRGKHAGLFFSSNGWSDSEKEIVRGLMEEIYGQFTKKAAEGRHMPLDQLLELAGGKVYTGRDAKQLGLVDDLGTLQDSLDSAKKLAGISHDEKVELMVLPKPPSFFDALFGDVGAEEHESHLQAAGQTQHPLVAMLESDASPLKKVGPDHSRLRAVLARVALLQKLFEKPGAAMLMPLDLQIR